MKSDKSDYKRRLVLRASFWYNKEVNFKVLDRRLKFWTLGVLGGLVVLTGFWAFLPLTDLVKDLMPGTGLVSESGIEERFDFSSLSPVFRFSAPLPDNLEVKYVSEIESINIYDPDADQKETIDKSKIFIRYFKASGFLTLSTVNIISRKETSINGHPAVSYQIEKKTGIDDFPYQPFWRNQRHDLIDIRFSSENPTYFYVFSYSPELEKEGFDSFIDSLVFDSDKESLSQPLEMADRRITKKPFGIFVSPDNSPVSPERFTGYHNAIDYEIFDQEEDIEVPVFSVCGGEIIEKRSAGGYEGLVIQKCFFDDQPVIVYYGHISLGSVEKGAGSYLSSGEKFAFLGRGYSQETNGERKHLHLGVSKGTQIDIRGYLQNQSELSNWIDFSQFIESD